MLRDELMDYPAKKRRVSSHMVRESVSLKYNVSMGAMRRRSDSSLSKTGSGGTPSSRRASLRKSGSFASVNGGGGLETPVSARVSAPYSVVIDYSGYGSTPTARSIEARGMLAGFDEPATQKSVESIRSDTFSTSQESSQPLRRSTRLSTLRRELNDQFPYQEEEQRPVVRDTTLATPPSPEVVADDSIDISTPVSDLKAQPTALDLSKDCSHTQSGRVAKSTATKKSKGLVCSQLPQRRSNRIGKRRL